MKKNTRSFWWLIPFGAFVGGYFATRLLFSASKVPVPRLVGLSLEAGIKRASDNHLSVQIIAEKEDINVAPGTIISQKPLEHQIARQHQVIYIITAQRPEAKKTPDFRGKPLDQVIQELTKAAITYNVITLPIENSETTVIAQWPTPAALLQEPLYLYHAQRQERYILPDFSAHPLQDVTAFLEKHTIPVQVEYAEPAQYYYVAQQRPLPGTIIARANPPTVQLLATATCMTPA